jgi:hypothetical protein
MRPVEAFRQQPPEFWAMVKLVSQLPSDTLEATMASTIPPEWAVLSKQEVFDGSPWLRVFAEKLRLPDGREIEDFYRLEMPDYAVIFATVGDRILVQRNYKHGPARVGLHLPAGHLEPDEEPLAAAQRELLEETGFISDTWALLGRSSTTGIEARGRHIFFERRTHARSPRPAQMTSRRRKPC